MNQRIRKNIMTKEDAYQIIKTNQLEKMDLLSYLQENCDYVSKEEQKEIEKMDIDFSDCPAGK